MSSRSAVALLVLLLAAPVSALQFTNHFVFGDSIVDTGNTQDLVVGLGGADPAPAAAGYFGGRFTNGINPADVLNLEIEGSVAVGSRLGGDNYAYGGARARTTADIVPDLAAQVTEFLGDVGGVADPTALYTINIGGNDIRDILLDSLDPSLTIGAAVTELATQLSVLSAAGAKHFLVVGVGDVGAIPEIQPFGAAAIAAGRSLSESLNAAIVGALPAGAAYFDTIAFQDALALDPTLFGLPAGLNLTDACLGSGAADPGGPPTCNDYAFFDTVHPTSQVLELLGEGLVTTVPEPGTGLLVAFGVVALAWRRRSA